MVFNKFKKMMGGGDESATDFIEIDSEKGRPESKVVVKTFVLKVYEDINPILNTLREGYSIALIDIRTLKSKDVIELKRAIAKIKKTVEAQEGKIAGFGDNIIIATPSKVFDIQKGFAEVVDASKKRDELERY